jgi:nicotinamide riboside kinase
MTCDTILAEFRRRFGIVDNDYRDTSWSLDKMCNFLSTHLTAEYARGKRETEERVRDALDLLDVWDAPSNRADGQGDWEPRTAQQAKDDLFRSLFPEQDAIITKID